MVLVKNLKIFSSFYCRLRDWSKSIGGGGPEQRRGGS